MNYVNLSDIKPVYLVSKTSFDPSSDTPIASPNPLPFSHLSLQEPASGAELGGSVSSFTYYEVPESKYTSSIGMSSQQPPLEEPSILSPLSPSSLTTRMTSLYRHSLVANSHLTSIWL